MKVYNNAHPEGIDCGPTRPHSGLTFRLDLYMGYQNRREEWKGLTARQRSASWNGTDLKDVKRWKN